MNINPIETKEKKESKKKKSSKFIESEERNQDKSSAPSKVMLSSEFQIANLKDAIDIIEDIKQMDKEQWNFDLKQGFYSNFRNYI